MLSACSGCSSDFGSDDVNAPEHLVEVTTRKSSPLILMLGPIRSRRVFRTGMARPGARADMCIVCKLSLNPEILPSRKLASPIHRGIENGVTPSPKTPSNSPFLLARSRCRLGHQETISSSSTLADIVYDTWARAICTLGKYLAIYGVRARRRSFQSPP